MLNNQDEIAEFDQQLGEILRGLEGITNERLTDQVRSLMAKLFFHDFADWSSDRGRWAIPEFCFEEFDSDDERKVRSVADACITILKTHGKAGEPALKTSGRDYLRSRGVDSAPVVVSINEIAAIIGILPTSIPTGIKREFGTPVSGGTRGKPATWNRDAILPILERQWPQKSWSNL